MNSLKSIFVSITILLTFTSCDAQIINAKTTTVKVWGNCGMCKRTIETAVNKKKKVNVVWSKETKQAQITYDSTKTTLDVILKQRIADAGYDNEKYTANEKVYNNLHGCCQYERRIDK